MQSRDCRRILRCIFSLTLLLRCVSPLIAQVPIETPAHRVLELPKNGSADLQKQMFLLQQLKAMLGGATPNAQPANQPQSPPPVLPEQLQNMKKLFDQFGGQIPEGMMPRPEDIPPELIEQVKANPQLKRQVEQMLQQYKQDGRLPQSDGRGGFQMPLPPTDGSQPQPKPQDNAGRNPGIRPADRRPDPGPNGSQALEPPQRQPGNSREPNSEDSKRRADALQRFKEMWENANPPATASDGNSQRNTDGSPGSNAGEPSQRPSGDMGSTATLPETQAGWDKLLNDLIQQQRDGANGIVWNPQPDGESNSPAGNNRPGSQSNSGQPSSQSMNDRNGKPSVQEFLEQMKGVVPPDFDPSRTTANRNGEPAGVSEEAAAQAAREEVIKRQQETSDSLQSQGLRATLKNIVKDAQRKAKEEQARALVSGEAEDSTEPGGDTAAGGMSGAMLETLKEISKDVVEMVKDGDLSISGNPNGSNDNNNNNNNGGAETQPSQTTRPNESDSMFGGFREVAGELISDLSEPEPPAANNSASPESILPDELPSLSNWIVPLLVLALIGGLLAWRMGVIDVNGVLAGPSKAIRTDQVRTKADVVRAFHSMALKPVRKTQNWWTHQMVKQHITTQTPEKTYQVGVLTELYEHARYLPDEQDFTPEQIQEARRALQQCEER